MRTYSKNLYSTILENFKEINSFLVRDHIPKLSKDQINNLNRPINHKEIKEVIKNLPNKLTNKTQEPKIFNRKFYKSFKKIANTNTSQNVRHNRNKGSIAQILL